MNPIFDDYTGEFYDEGREAARRHGIDHVVEVVRKHLDANEDCKGEVSADEIRELLEEL